MNSIGSQLYILKPTILLLLFLFPACGETEEQVEQTPPPVIMIDPPPPDTGYNPENEDAFEYTVWREYSELATQVPRRLADSVLRSVTSSSPDPWVIKKRLKQELEKLNRLQDTIARYTLHDKYNISYDSIQAIIEEVEGKIKRGEIE